MPQHDAGKGRSLFHQAWELASRSGEVYLAIEAAVMLSISQPPKYQNSWLQRAIVLAEKTENDRQAMACSAVSDEWLALL